MPALPEIDPVMVLEKVLLPEKVLSLASKVDEAAVMVMSCEPLNETPFMLRAVWRTVAEPALPETVPVRFPVALVKKRFVVEAVVAKRLVVVAAVVVLREIASKIWLAVKVLAVYVLGIVVDEWMKACTRESA